MIKEIADKAVVNPGKLLCFICNTPFELEHQETHLPFCQACRLKIQNREIGLPIGGRVIGNLVWIYPASKHENKYTLIKGLVRKWVDII